MVLLLKYSHWQTIIIWIHNCPFPTCQRCKIQWLCGGLLKASSLCSPHICNWVKLLCSKCFCLLITQQTQTNFKFHSLINRSSYPDAQGSLWELSLLFTEGNSIQSYCVPTPSSAQRDWWVEPAPTASRGCAWGQSSHPWKGRAGVGSLHHGQCAEVRLCLIPQHISPWWDVMYSRQKRSVRRWGGIRRGQHHVGLLSCLDPSWPGNLPPRHLWVVCWQCCVMPLLSYCSAPRFCRADFKLWLIWTWMTIVYLYFWVIKTKSSKCWLL